MPWPAATYEHKHTFLAHNCPSLIMAVATLQAVAFYWHALNAIKYGGITTHSGSDKQKVGSDKINAYPCSA